MNRILATGVFLAALASPFAAAQPYTTNVSLGLTEKGVPLAAHGFDVVSFFTDRKPEQGLGAHTAVYDGAAYRFATEAHLKAFQAAPQKYAPQYGGFCAFGAANAKKADGNPRFWKVVNDKLYFNLNEDVQAKWEADVPGNVAKADVNWKRIADKAPNKL